VQRASALLQQKHMDVDITQIGRQEKIIFEDWATIASLLDTVEISLHFKETNTQKIAATNEFYSNKEKHS